MNELNNIKLNEDSNLLKIIALVAMLIDHIGYVFFEDVLILRMIGRLSFPLFAYSTFIGYFKTKDLKKYIVRLFIIALITEPIYDLLFIKEYFSLNIIFSLLFEVIILYLLDNKKYFYIVIPITLMIYFNVEYCYHLLLLIPIFYYCNSKKLLFLFFYIVFYSNFLLDINISQFALVNFCGILSLPLILFKTKSKLKVNKWFYYLFYPLHLLLIYVIKLII